MYHSVSLEKIKTVSIPPFHNETLLTWKQNGYGQLGTTRHSWSHYAFLKIAPDQSPDWFHLLLVYT